MYIQLKDQTYNCMIYYIYLYLYTHSSRMVGLVETKAFKTDTHINKM